MTGAVASVAGYVTVTSIHPQTYLTEQELSTSRFVWTSLPSTQFVFTDWTRGTGLMYGHRYSYGPDPYTMSPALFQNITYYLFYSDNPDELRHLIPEATGSNDYSLYLSVEMMQKGPGGPDHTYLPAGAELFNRFSESPYFNVVYSSGATILIQPSN